MKKAVILFSGGLDSTTCLALAKSKGFDCHALSFDYGQRHHFELEVAKREAQKWGVPLKVFQLDLRQFGQSSLTDDTMEVPEGHDPNGIPNTYVPARNTVFLSLALAYAESIDARDLFIGVSQIDYSNYPDCRRDYIDAFEAMANLGTKAVLGGAPYQIHTPLVYLTKAETIQLGRSLGVDYAQTVSCYQLDASLVACGVCPSCVLRKRAFIEAGIADVTPYRTPGGC